MHSFNELQRLSWLFFCCFCPLILLGQPSSQIGLFDTFFSYSKEDLQAIRSVPLSNESLSQEKFERWDPLLYKLTADPKPDGQTTRLMVYLYVAQRDFALLSYRFTQRWIGNPDSLTVKIIQLVYPDFQSEKSMNGDLYSEKIGEIVFRKIKERWQFEEEHLKDYPIREGSDYWKETPPYLGQRIGSCQPWLLTSLKDVQAIPPPGPKSIIWTYGLNQIEVDQARLTPEQRQLIYYWAGKEGPESGNWFAISNQYLQKKSLSPQKFLLIRAVFAMGLIDALIAAFDAKYTYWVMRPHMLDPHIIPIVTVPKHPSYPSAHSVSSSTAAFILSEFFPEETQKWRKLAIEAGNTRIWGGLHYMYDNEEGLIQGEKVGRVVINRLQKGISKIE